MKFTDFRSDTVTQPTDEMRKAISQALVGDDVYDDDPTVKELEMFASELLGKEAALFVPSGTFANQLAVLTHTRRGDEIIVGHDCHIMMHEVGATAVIAGVHTRSVKSTNGYLNPTEVEKSIREEDIHYPDTGLICIENAHSSGSVVSLENMKAIKAIADKHKVPLHMDGARFFNAARRLKEDYKVLASCADTINICLSKGLCAPVGSLLVGPEAFIKKAKRNRKLMGGGMRQVGMLAAAGLIALKDMVDRLDEDHDNAKYMADQLETINGIKVLRDRLDINMVFFTLSEEVVNEAALVEGLYDRKIKVNGTEEGEYRFVTNNDVNRKDIDALISAMKEIIL